MAERHYGRNRTKFAKENTRRGRSLEIKKLQEGGFTVSGESSAKILNTDSNKDACKFLTVCDSFEKTLQEINLNENCHEIYEKLKRIRNLIDIKISLGKMAMGKSFDSLLLSSESCISYLSQSMESLCSVNSCNMATNNNSGLEKYMNTVNCPFCSEIQSDEISFVEHLDKICSSHKKKEFKKRDNFPYAIFQILPNNTFKCNICENATARNIQYFYLHMQSKAHLLDCAKASKTKKYENLVFCSCCKVMVYNNYKQIKSHIDNKSHLSKCSSKKNIEYFIRRGIHCIFNDSKKFKCLDCPPVNAVCSSPEAVLEHFSSSMHKRYKKKDAPNSSTIYCEMCSEEVHLIDLNHFNSNQHQANEKKLKESGFEVCFFCGFCCNNLNELSFHMEAECAEITTIRQEISGKKENVTEGQCMTSEKCTKRPESLKKGEFINDKNEIKLSNATDLKLGGSAETHETESESEDSDSNSDAETIQDDHLDKLFARVSDHLMKTTLKLNTAQEIKIQYDCIQTLLLENCHFVGFSGSGLSFPSESINLFCASKTDTSMATVPENLLKASHIILSDSKLWKNVHLFNNQGPYPCLKCVHKETQRLCTIIVDESSLEVTKMLRKCMEKSELVKPFCLIIRFWLTVHELKIRNFEFALISLLVFFLLNANVVTLSENEYKDSVLTTLIKKEINVQPPEQSSESITNVKELFQKFLCFLNSFNFDDNAIFLPLRDPVPKSLFGQGVFKELPLIKNLKTCSMCILAPNAGVNLAADIEWEDRKAFLKIVAATVKHYNIK